MMRGGDCEVSIGVVTLHTDVLFSKLLSEHYHKIPEFFENIFFGGGVAYSRAAEFGFEVGDALEGVVFCVDGGDAEEIVSGAAAGAGVLHYFPLEEVGSHHVAVFVGGGAVVVGGGVTEVGGD